MNNRLKAGAAQSNITPLLGTSLAGYFHDRKAVDVYDDLHAKALVLDDGNTKIALVVCDLIALILSIRPRGLVSIQPRGLLNPSLKTSLAESFFFQFVHFGQPCIAGTRIPVYCILELVHAGISFDEIITKYYSDITIDDIKACIQYAIDIIKSEEIHLAEAAAS